MVVKGLMIMANVQTSQHANRYVLENVPRAFWMRITYLTGRLWHSYVREQRQTLCTYSINAGK
jgi:hypothetical protein